MLSGLLLTIGATWLLYLSGLFVLWTPLPLLYWYYRSGFKAFVLAALLSFGGLVTLYHFLSTLLPLKQGGMFLAVPGLGLYDFFGAVGVQAFAFIYFFCFVLIAGLLGWAHQRRDSINKTFLIAVIVPVVVSVGLMFIAAAWQQVNLIHEVRGYIAAILDQILELGGPQGMTRQDVVVLTEHREVIVTTLLEVMPSALLIGCLLTVWCNVLAARWWFPQRTMFRHFGPLCLWKLADRWVWLVIAGGALYFLNLYFFEWRPLAILATNMLWILGVVYFLQGLAVLSFWLQKRRSLILKGLAYGAVILFFQVMAFFLTIIGIFDIWFDFRKLNAVKS